MTQLLVASTNKGKLRDFAAVADKRVWILALPGLDAIAAPAEDETTFEGNARIKAIYYSKFAPGEIVIADDSGLEVDALDGAPGVRSARYADDCGFLGEGAVGASTDERNNLCLIEALREVPSDMRHGRYRCVIVAARDGKVISVGGGAVEGTILTGAQGDGGFGYDPFFLPAGESKTMAELDMETRMSLSHRGRALQELLLKLKASGVEFSG